MRGAATAGLVALLLAAWLLAPPPPVSSTREGRPPDGLGRDAQAEAAANAPSLPQALGVDWAWWPRDEACAAERCVPVVAEDRPSPRPWPTLAGEG